MPARSEGLDERHAVGNPPEGPPLSSVGAMDERQRRIGLNEAVFREANERIEEVNRTFGAADR